MTLAPWHLTHALTEARQQVIACWCRAARASHGGNGQLRAAILAEAALEVVRRDPGAEQLTLNLAQAALETYRETAPRPRAGSSARPLAGGPPGPVGGPATGGDPPGGPGAGG